MKDVEIIGMIKSYVKQTLVGMGALKGAPCQVQGVVDEGDGTQTLTLKWVDNNGDSHTTNISLPTAIFEITNPTNGQTIRYNGTSGKWENSNVSFSADLGDLDDVVITSATNGQVLTYDVANNQWINSDGSTVADLGDLTDVTITSVQNGQILSYNSTSNKWVNVSLDIDDLGNVSITSVADGQILTYNGTSGKWENKTLDIDASDVDYDNTTSQMQATSVQDAIDENAGEIKQIKLDIDQLSASKIGYDGTTSGLSANKVQGAIDENAGEITQIKLDIEQLTASKIGYDGTTSGLSANKVQAAIDEVAADLDDKQDKLTAGDGINIDAQNEIKVVKRLIVTDTMPTPSADYVGEGKQRLYVGNTGTYTKGTIYECQSDGATPPTYSWVGISSAEVDLTDYKKIFNKTSVEWEQLSTAEKIVYDLAMFSDDADNGDIATVVEAGNHNPVASDAVNTKIESLDYSDSAVAGSYVTEVSEADGIIAVQREAADASPTENSNKMVKSGGVFTSEQDIYEVMGKNSAKNLLPFNLAEIKEHNTDGTWNGNEYTINGITYTVSDGVYIANNTSTGNANIYPSKNTMTFYLDAGSYIATGCPDGGANDKYYIDFYNGTDAASLGFDYGDGVEFTLTEQKRIDVRISVRNGTSTSDLEFKPMIRLASDTDATYQPFAMTNQQITPYVQAISNPNLLDNPWFTVNQRGQSTYSSVSYSYTVDRWLGSDGFDLYVNSDGVSVSTANKSIFERIDDSLYSLLIGKTVTLSALKSDGNIVSVSGVVKSDGNSFGYESDSDISLYLTKDQYANFVQVVLKNTTVKVRAVKLELGTQTTLAHDTAPNYQQELAKCQRYYQEYRAGSTNVWLALGFSATATQVESVFRLSVPMRTKPTATFSNCIVTNTHDEKAVSAINPSQADVNNSILHLVLTTASMASVDAPYALRLNANNGKLAFSADL